MMQLHEYKQIAEKYPYVGAFIDPFVPQHGAQWAGLRGSLPESTMLVCSAENFPSFIEEVEAEEGAGTPEPISKPTADVRQLRFSQYGTVRYRSCRYTDSPQVTRLMAMAQERAAIVSCEEIEHDPQCLADIVNSSHTAGSLTNTHRQLHQKPGFFVEASRQRHIQLFTRGLPRSMARGRNKVSEVFDHFFTIG